MAFAHATKDPNGQNGQHTAANNPHQQQQHEYQEPPVSYADMFDTGVTGTGYDIYQAGSHDAGMQAMAKAIYEQLVIKTEELAVRSVVLDHSDSGMPYSYQIVTAAFKKNPKVVAGTIVVYQGTGPGMQPIQFQSEGANLVVAGRLAWTLDDQMKEIIHREVQKNYPDVQTLRYVNPYVIHKQTAITDHEGKPDEKIVVGAVNSLRTSMTTLLATMLTFDPAVQSTRLPNLRPVGATVSVAVTWNPPETTYVLGHVPTARTDMVFSITSSARNLQRVEINQPNTVTSRSSVLGQVPAYIDLQYLPKDTRSLRVGEAQKSFVPIAVQTGYTADAVSGHRPCAIAVAAAMMVEVFSSGQWVRPYLRVGQGFTGRDPTYLTCISGIETPDKGVVFQKTPDLFATPAPGSQNPVADFLHTQVDDERANIAIDIPSTGPFAQLMTVWMSAAERARSGMTPVEAAIYQDAKMKIWTELMLVTGDQIQNFFSPNKPFLYETGLVQFYGTFREQSTGMFRSLSEIDFLYGLNFLGDSNPQGAREWMDIFTNGPLNPPVALNKLRRYLDIMTAGGNDLNILDNMYRYHWNPEFLVALRQALGASGFAPLLDQSLAPIFAGKSSTYAATAQYGHLGQNGLNTRVGVTSTGRTTQLFV